MFYTPDLDTLELGILAELEQLRIYDTHEHLPPETSRLASKPDAFTLFSHYCQHDLYTAGLDKPTMGRILWKPEDIDWKWSVFKPYYERMKDTCYCRSAHITLEKFYGVTELTDENYRAVSEAVAANNTPGLYHRVLRDACGIEKCVNCDYDGQSDEGGLIAQTLWVAQIRKGSDFIEYFGRMPVDLADAAQLAEDRLADAKRRGAPGMKVFAFDTSPVADADADAVLRELLAHPDAELDDKNPLNRWMKLRQMLCADRLDLVCCVHTGYWNDYRELNPANLLPLIREHHFMKIDLYHVGYPYMREAIMLGKVWPGVRMDMAWTYLISRKFAYEALDEMLEMLPDNKIFGFGGDYYVIEKVFGHLCMARETISRVLAGKVRRGEMTLERALEHGRRMLVDNPKEFYGF